MEKSAENTSEAPRPRNAVDSLVNDVTCQLDQIKIKFEKEEESIEAAGTSLRGHNSQSSPTNGSSNQTHQLGFEPYNPLSHLNFTRIQTDFGVNGSIPPSAWVNHSVDKPSSSYSARQCDPFNEISSLSSWAYQTGGNNSSIWRLEDNSTQTNLGTNSVFASQSPHFDQFEATQGATDNLLQRNFNHGFGSVSPQIGQFAATRGGRNNSMQQNYNGFGSVSPQIGQFAATRGGRNNSMQQNYNGFGSVSPQIGQFAATWGGRNNLMQQNYNGFGSVNPQTTQFAAAERDGSFSVSEWNRSSWLFGGLRNQEGYENGGQGGIQFEQVDMVQLAMTPEGSKRLQDILVRRNFGMTNMIFEKTLEGMLLMMNDKHGHLFFAKFIENCNAIQFSMIVAKITLRAEDLLETSCHPFGSQCIKGLIGVLDIKNSPQMIARVTSALSYIFYNLMTNKTGSYAVLKCFEAFHPQENQVLYRKLVEQCIDLAIDEIGCLSLNRSIQYIRGDLRYQLLQKISDSAVYLAHDPYGTFVLQNVIELGNPVLTPRICSLLKGHYVELSVKVSGSHVVERCLTSRIPEMIFAVEDLLEYDKLVHVATNQYGNYVIQCALRETKRIGDPLHQELLSKVLSLGRLNHGYGKKVVNYIQRGCPLDK
ncbi:hypothetical protein L6164_036009 [Bauhinia variegata]|uniref:Uncharacterized protein n=1 Tax=Bauhinia variegata TaxID=167791 RepID=A0ACB9KFM8_BAUVA|nr:hypothetical protein L6164_036009 [Bauhinia variegata]